MRMKNNTSPLTQNVFCTCVVKGSVTPHCNFVLLYVSLLALKRKHNHFAVVLHNKNQYVAREIAAPVAHSKSHFTVQLISATALHGAFSRAYDNRRFEKFRLAEGFCKY